ncbi:unnamed protein product [Didymodactylos carnosus]|uniref:Uncharacterized protein n=1 Tax=Didymodactylos carnosus TaxID=1234261 RepID=A0A8S2JR75_9BILA|nr:unnamed protein product [Didymodactylos carnosus]CAF3818540.1 unnamed protein product [Didymodactylos carnosus]
MDYRHTDPDSTTSSWNSNNQTSNYNNNSNLHSSLKDRDDGYSGFKKNDSDNTHDYHSGWSSQHNENSYTYEKHPSSSTSKYEESTSRSSLSENMNVNNPVVANDLKKKEQQGKQHAEDIFTKTKKVLRQKCKFDVKV